MSFVDRPQSRWVKTLSHLPVGLFEGGLGGLFGGRLVLLYHRGRHTGTRYSTALEVVAHHAEPPVWYVAAAWGERADWLQNLQSHPDATLMVGRRLIPVVSDILDVADGARVYAEYARTRRLTARVIGRVIGVDIRRDPPPRLAARMPIVALRAVNGGVGSYADARSDADDVAADEVAADDARPLSDVARVLTTRAQTRATYDRIAPFYQALEGRWERKATERGLAALAARPGESVLEIGCGPGVALVDLARAVRPQGLVVGLDLSARMCRIALRRIRRAHLEGVAHVIQGDASALPITGESLDACLMSFTLELFDTPEISEVLYEVRQALRAGGRIGVVALSRAGPDSLGRRLYEWGHDKLPRLLDCRPIYPAARLVEAGFTITSEHRVSLWGLPVDVVVAVNPRS